MLREAKDGVVVTVRVRPRSRPGIERTEDALVIGVSAPPVGGRATEEARRALAAALHVPISAIVLRTGATSRTKAFLVAGLSAAEATARLGK